MPPESFLLHFLGSRTKIAAPTTDGRLGLLDKARACVESNEFSALA